MRAPTAFVGSGITLHFEHNFALWRERMGSKGP
jgi:hypothetical protein